MELPKTHLMSQPDENQGAVPVAPSWSEADLAWLEKLDLGTQVVARRYGRELTELVLVAGSCGHALGIIQQVLQKHQSRGGMTALQVVGGNLNALLTLTVISKGFSKELFESCREDLERAAMLSSAGVKLGEKRTNGGLIVTS